MLNEFAANTRFLVYACAFHSPPNTVLFELVPMSIRSSKFFSVVILQVISGVPAIS